MEKIWDVIIIGAGPAGLSAGIYAARQGHSTLLLHSGKVGGRALEAHRIDNYPGFPQGLTGAELMNLFNDQARRFGVEFKRETVIGLADAGEFKIVSTRSGYHQGKTVIIAAGVQRKQLSVPGEMEFKGRGVSYCAICDGPFFREKVVTVVGSGHEAVQDALHLTNTASKVIIIPGKKGFSEKYTELATLRVNPKVEFIEGQDIAEITGNEFVTGVKLTTGWVENIATDGVFILLEHISTSNILVEAGIDADEGGCILVDRNQQTNLPGFYAAGDCCCMGWQIVTAAGEGAKAALSAMKFVKQKGTT
ncbi:MAG: FAD-dependent oxidoreductase [Candidatus Bathyarchaeia archaeon]|jgi:thioredoxin reductase (NADPH)